jgi:hypothetical protein
MVTHQHNNYRINSYAAILLDLLVSALSANPGRFKTWGGTLRSCGVVDGDSMVGANPSSSPFNPGEMQPSGRFVRSLSYLQAHFIPTYYPWHPYLHYFKALLILLSRLDFAI